MKLKILKIFLLLLLSSTIDAQIFFPIIIPTQRTVIFYNCPTRNDSANQCLNDGIDNINKDIEQAKRYFKDAIQQDSQFCDAYDYLAYCYRTTNHYDSAIGLPNICRIKS